MAASKKKTSTEQEAPKFEGNPFKPGEMKPSGYLNNRWETYAPGATNPESLEDPQYWVFMRALWKEGDEIRVTADDISWVAYGIVTNAQAGDIRVKFHDVIELEPRSEKEIEYQGYFIRNGGQIKKYYIANMKTGDVIREGLPTQREAMNYVDDQLKAA